MGEIVWVHGDCLRATNPALRAAPQAPAIFVWDDALLRQYQVSLKRIVFMYEALLELPVDIYRGDVVAQVRAFAQHHHAERIVTSASVAPRFGALVKQLRVTHAVTIMPEPAFVDAPAHMDVRRFSRYWRVVASQLSDAD